MRRLIWYAAFCALILFSACECDEPLTSQLTITRLSPQEGGGGQVVLISGKRLETEGLRILFNGREAKIDEIVSDTLIKVVTPENVSSGFVEVAYGTYVAQGPFFTVLRNPTPPVITALSSTTAEIGEILTMSGLNFKTGSDKNLNHVKIDSIEVQVLEASETELRILIPHLYPGMYPVTVTVWGATSDALSLEIKSFAGTLQWPSVPNFYVQYESRYVVRAAADGSTVRKTFFNMAYPGLLSNFHTGLEVPISYDVASSTLYVNRYDPDAGTYIDSKITTTGWDDLTDVDLSGGPRLWSTTNPGASSATDDYFARMNTDPETQAVSYTIMRVPRNETSPETDLDLGSTQPIRSMAYNSADQTIYFMTGSGGVFSLNSIREDGTNRKTWIENFTSPDYTSVYDDNVRNLVVLQTSSGAKVYWIAPYAGAEAVWMANLSPSNTEYVPIVLYEKMADVNGSLNGSDSQYPRYYAPFLILN